MAPAPGPTCRRARRRCTTTPPRTPSSSPSITGTPGSTTLPRPTARCRATKPGASWASGRISGSSLPEGLAQESRAGEPVAPGLLHRLGDADAGSHRDLAGPVARAQREGRRVQGKPVLGPGDAERLAQTARSGAQLLRVGDPASRAHLIDAGDRLERADQHGAGS